jgi:hypothetical protein
MSVKPCRLKASMTSSVLYVGRSLHPATANEKAAMTRKRRMSEILGARRRCDEERLASAFSALV